MARYILIILLFVLLLIITLLNIIGEQMSVSINLIFFKLPPIPGIILVYIGMILGSLLTIPLVFSQIRKSESKVLDSHIKNETKRMKKIKKQDKEAASQKKGNVNSKPNDTTKEI